MTIDQMLADLAGLHPKRIDLSLDRVLRLLDALDRPHLKLPPVIHVAGTNGKGSVTAYLAAMAAAQGLAAHVYTSPHLVRFNERIALRGSAIGDDALADILRRTEAANAGEAVTFFEVTTAAAFLAFAETPADLVILETGLGGRLDATNVVPQPAVTVLTAISMDHEDFLGSDLAGIAAEKAAILKPGAAAVSAPQDPVVQAVIDARAAAIGIAVATGGRDWTVRRQVSASDSIPDGGLRWSGPGGDVLDLPLPALPGPHQVVNAGLAVAAARAPGLPRIRPPAIAEGLRRVSWPGRMQRVEAGPLPEAEVWLDGGHNPSAGIALAATLRELPQAGRPLWLVVGMKPNKDAAAYLDALAPLAAGLVAIPIPGEDSMPAAALAAIAKARGVAATVTAATPAAALAHIAAAAPRARVVVCGSLYLVGAVLASPLTGPSRASSATAAR